jgi:hypothetical protein
MNKVQIAAHILYDCIGDNCECCDWSDADRAVMEAMSMEEADGIVSEYEAHAPAMPEGDGMTDAEADADVLASAGWGTDEDYGYYGGED